MQEREPRQGTGEGVGEANAFTGTSAGTMSASDEKLWSMLSHVSILVAPLGALLIWLIFKDKSERVRFHALQALLYQVAWIAIMIVLFIVISILSVVTLGIGALLFIPYGFLPLVPLVHSLYAAYRVNQGEEYRYMVVADYADGGNLRPRRS